MGTELFVPMDWAFPVDNGALDYFRGLFVFYGKIFLFSSLLLRMPIIRCRGKDWRMSFPKRV